MKVRMRFSIAGEYDIDTGEGDADAYGTTDPAEMAAIDQEQLRNAPWEFVEHASEYIVGVVRTEP